MTVPSFMFPLSLLVFAGGREAGQVPGLLRSSTTSVESTVKSLVNPSASTRTTMLLPSARALGTTIPPLPSQLAAPPTR
jgi:hypothetical protein